MIQRIERQLQVIEKANSWIQTALEGNKRRESHDVLVKCRRELKKKKLVLESNPATAIYGESQVGKSYLVSSLLSGKHSQFSLQGGDGKEYNFIEAVNPPGGGSESTSLVSRFSVNYSPINPDFPIKAVLLSPADLILVLCDGFYNDIKLKETPEVHLLTAEELKLEVQRIKEQYKGFTPIQSDLTEDDVLDIKDYFETYFQKADRIKDSGFFKEIPQLIQSVEPSHWKDVFCLLWNKDHSFTDLFGQLVSEYQKLGFTKELYLPIESVLYTHGTLLDVKRMHEIYSEPDHLEPNYTPSTTVLLKNGSQVLFSKSFLCALTAELVFGQPKDLVKEKPFLAYTDLLDFPGARSRMEIQLNAVEKESIPALLLRGKVAYLFNKYSDSERIRILMFCAKHEQTAQRFMPGLLNNWIGKVIGQDAKARDKFIETSKISPLFIIGTFFNVNMAYDPLHDGKDQSSLNYRWKQRFDTTLAKEYIEVENPTYSWFNNWTLAEPFFRNIYLLRDFEKSETPSRLFIGYNQYKEEKEEVILPQNPNFRRDLRQSFIDYDFVKKHFVDPAASWDAAASMNKDGTDLIIEKLTIAAANSKAARQSKIKTDLMQIFDAILAELNKHYHSADKDEELLRAKSTAGNIQLKLDTAFAADGIRQYGRLMRDLMVDEGEVLHLFRECIDDIEHQDVVNQDIYSTYRIMVPVEPDDTVESYFEKLCVHYEKVTDEQKEQFRKDLADRHVNLDDLISGGEDFIKNNAQQLADALLKYWLSSIFKPDKRMAQHLLVEDGSSSLQDIAEMFEKLFSKIDLSNVIARHIRGYVDGHGKTDLPYEIVADISAELLNRCVQSVGFDYFDDAEITSLKQANDKNALGLVFETVTETETTLEKMFYRVENWTDILKSNPEEMRLLPSYKNYIDWYNRLKIGFVSVCDIPNYDVAANERLGKIIKECSAIGF